MVSQSVPRPYIVLQQLSRGHFDDVKYNLTLTFANKLNYLIVTSYCFLLNTIKHDRYFLKCDLLFVITLKTNKTGFTIGTLFKLQAHIFTKIALFRYLE